MTKYDVLDFYKYCKSVCRQNPYNGESIEGNYHFDSPAQLIDTIQQQRGKINEIKLHFPRSVYGVSLEKYLNSHHDCDRLTIHWQSYTYIKDTTKKCGRVTSLLKTDNGWNKVHEWSSSLEYHGSKGVPLFTNDQKQIILKNIPRGIHLNMPSASFLIKEFRGIVESVISVKHNGICSSNPTYPCDAMVEQVAPSLAWCINNEIA